MFADAIEVMFEFEFFFADAPVVGVEVVADFVSLVDVVAGVAVIDGLGLGRKEYSGDGGHGVYRD